MPAASLTAKGTVQLSSATDSQSETEAATPKAVKAAYDLAAGKAPVSHTHPWSQI
ncbi:phage tail protein, partial [Acinetobacter baumannii]|nr:phage tail protein [Acinetobacter baumannii]